jgi:hypothetical protein
MFLIILSYRYFSKLYFSDCKLIDHHIDSVNSNNNDDIDYKLVEATDNDNDDQDGITIVNE